MSKFIRSTQVFFHGAQGAVNNRRKKSFSNGVGRGETIKGKRDFFWLVETESKNEIDGIWAFMNATLYSQTCPTNLS